MGTPYRSVAFRKSNDSARLIITTVMGMVFGYFIGISFPLLSLAKINLPSSLISSLDVAFGEDHQRFTDRSFPENLGSGSTPTTPKIYVPSNPRGAESLPPGIVVSESDFYLRRLWGEPSEDLKRKPKYLVTFTVGLDQKNNINAAVKKFSEDFQIMLFHYDGRTTEWDQFEWSKRAIHVSVRKQTKWWYAKRFLHPDVVAAYDYIFIWDEDLGVEHFNAHNFVEIMAPVFSREAWRCVWHMIQNDLVHGWGLDFALRRCVEPAHEKIGVVDSQWIIHQVIPSLGNQGRSEDGKAPWQGATYNREDLEECENRVKSWASSSQEFEASEHQKILKDFLFFLHVPRTGGKNYHHCILEQLYDTSSRCPHSYDRLRFNPRNPRCNLTVTHDDYSLMSRLPKDKTSVVTIIRNPIERVISSYEFSIEVAARSLQFNNLTTAIQVEDDKPNVTERGVTQDIWPWRYLVPWMMHDLFSRRDQRKLKGESVIISDDPYNMEEILMPLHQFIKEPIALDLVHNGATFQVAGLTNNSYSKMSHQVRHCVLKYPSLGEYVLEVAKRRLDNMLYVGLTDKHKESATLFANVVGDQVTSKLAQSRFSRNSSAIQRPGHRGWNVEDIVMGMAEQSAPVDLSWNRGDVYEEEDGENVMELLNILGDDFYPGGNDFVVDDFDATKLGPIPFDDAFVPFPLNSTIQNDSSNPPFLLKSSFSQKQQLNEGALLLGHKNKNCEVVMYQTQSPVSVLDTTTTTTSASSSSSSSGKPGGPTNPELTVPVRRPRSKRTRSSTVNPWLLIPPPIITTPHVAKKKMKRMLSRKPGGPVGPGGPFKKCSHCEATETPQWRAGPLGPKTLCNACGVRYRSGRLFPEYRPAASPTFVPLVHSNSHRKVIEMRSKVHEPEPVRDFPASPSPEFVPMSGYPFDCIY
ncbi:unnamed protein product [Cuscuta campestris]|uniref:GATA-type domain-containing protein n=1 Tax=Cuscuta campestris TaxID=132261 RepID=A0A484MRF8_9ASTE|nr:unnamed protein product [Cuscuta campestris]